MDDLLDLLIATPGPRGRAGLPAIFWGPPGIGKTATLERVAARLRLHLEVVLLSIREPADVAGLPIPGPDGVTLAPPAWARRLAEAGEGLLVLDELSCAAPAVQAAALRVVAEGVVGELALPPGVRVLAAANPEDQAAGGWALSPPLANRLLHLDWPAPSPEAWGAWLTGDGSTPTGGRTLDPAAWVRSWDQTRAGVAAFIRSRPELLLSLPTQETDRGRAWPSPRSWELAARGLAGARALGLADSRGLAVLSAAVGEGVAIEAWGYLGSLDLPDPEDVLAGRAAIPLDRGDKAYAGLSAVIATVMRDPPTDERRVRGLEQAAKVSARHADVAAAVIRPLAAQVAPLLRTHGVRVTAALAGPLASVAGSLAAAAEAALKPTPQRKRAGGRA